MHTSRWTILTGAAMCAVAVALPLVSLPLVGNVSGIRGDAWPILLWLAVPVILALVGDRAEGMAPAGSMSVIVLSAVAVVFAVAKWVDARLAVDIARDVGPAGIGPGAWLLVAGSLVTLAGAVASTSRRVAT